MANYECKKGWLLTPDEKSGVNVPFFVYVRDKDIMWSLEELDQKAVKAFMNGSIVESRIAPKITTILSKNGWEITAFGDDRYEATKKIKVGSTQFKENSSLPYDIFTTLNLPFTTMNDDRLNITCTMKSTSMDLASASFNLNHSDSESISSVEVHLLNPVFNFDPDREQNSEYNNSTIYVRISGRLKLS